MGIASLKQGGKLYANYSFQANRAKAVRGDAATALAAADAKYAEVWGPGFVLEWSPSADEVACTDAGKDYDDATKACKDKTGGPTPVTMKDGAYAMTTVGAAVFVAVAALSF